MEKVASLNNLEYLSPLLSYYNYKDTCYVLHSRFSERDSIMKSSKILYLTFTYTHFFKLSSQ